MMKYVARYSNSPKVLVRSRLVRFVDHQRRLMPAMPEKVHELYTNSIGEEDVSRTGKSRYRKQAV